LNIEYIIEEPEDENPIQQRVPSSSSNFNHFYYSPTLAFDPQPHFVVESYGVEDEDEQNLNEIDQVRQQFHLYFEPIVNS
jgi:hypothetical protein